MKTYTIIAGVNGVGKSSFTGLLRMERTDLGTIIDVDRMIREADGDVIAGGKQAIRRMEACLEKGICFTQESTLSGHWTSRTIRRAQEAGYCIRLYYIGLGSVQESLSRIENRVKKGGHAIPQEDVVRRYEKRFEDLAAALPYCNEAFFYDNENGFRMVAEYRNGTLLRVGEDPPQWVEELQQYYNCSETCMVLNS